MDHQSFHPPQLELLRPHISVELFRIIKTSLLNNKDGYGWQPFNKCSMNSAAISGDLHVIKAMLCANARYPQLLALRNATMAENIVKTLAMTRVIEVPDFFPLNDGAILLAAERGHLECMMLLLKSHAKNKVTFEACTLFLRHIAKTLPRNSDIPTTITDMLEAVIVIYGAKVSSICSPPWSSFVHALLVNDRMDLYTNLLLQFLPEPKFLWERAYHRDMARIKNLLKYPRLITIKKNTL